MLHVEVPLLRPDIGVPGVIGETAKGRLPGSIGNYWSWEGARQVGNTSDAIAGLASRGRSISSARVALIVRLAAHTNGPWPGRAFQCVLRVLAARRYCVIKDAVTHAKHGIRKYLPGDAETRSNIILNRTYSDGMPGEKDVICGIEGDRN